MRVSNSWIDTICGYRVILIDEIAKRYSHYIWWQNTGYWLDWDKKEIIHHINGDKLDDRFENLQLMTNNEHRSLHMRIWHKTNDQTCESNPNYDNIGSSNHKWIEGEVSSHVIACRKYRAKKRIAEGRRNITDILFIQ